MIRFVLQSLRNFFSSGGSRVSIGCLDTMLPLKSLIAFAVLWDYALSVPLEELVQRRRFTLSQIPVKRATPWYGPNSMRRAYMKYGVGVPEFVNKAAESVGPPPGQTTVGVRPVKGDVEFLISVQVGNHNLSLDLDTGSSDLYVLPPLDFPSSNAASVNFSHCPNGPPACWTLST
jgi:hypothetical protein